MREMQAPGPYLVVFPNRSFFLLVVAYAINTFGNWLTVVAAVAMATFEWHASALEVGGLIALFLLPPVIVSPLAGRLGDRLDKRQFLIAANSAAAVMVVLMPFAGNVWQAYPILLALRCLSAVNQPLLTALVPTLVPRPDILRANSLLLQPVHVTRAVSPLIGGLIVAASSASVAFAVDAATFVLASLILASLQLPRRQNMASVRCETGDASHVGGRRSATSWLAVPTWPGAVYLAFVGLTAAFAFGSLEIVAPLYVRDVLGEKAVVYGASVSCIGIGSVLGGLSPNLLPHEKALRLLPGTLAMTAGFALIAAIHLPVTLIVGVLIAGAGSGWALTVGQTTIHEETPAVSHASVLGVFAAVVNLGGVAGIFSASALAGVVGVTATLWCCAIAVSAVVWASPVRALVRARYMMRRRGVPDATPAGPPV